jgi:hypothetical protein
MEIYAGTEFSTLIEDHCIAIEMPDKDGNFSATDSEGVECTFNTNMVVGHENFIIPLWFRNHPQFIQSNAGKDYIQEMDGSK